MRPDSGLRVRPFPAAPSPRRARGAARRRARGAGARGCKSRAARGHGAAGLGRTHAGRPLPPPSGLGLRSPGSPTRFSPASSDPRAGKVGDSASFPRARQEVPASQLGAGNGLAGGIATPLGVGAAPRLPPCRSPGKSGRPAAPGPGRRPEGLHRGASGESHLGTRRPPRAAESWVRRARLEGKGTFLPHRPRVSFKMKSKEFLPGGDLPALFVVFNFQREAGSPVRQVPRRLSLTGAARKGPPRESEHTALLAAQSLRLRMSSVVFVLLMSFRDVLGAWHSNGMP